jgi:hypothetical protein
MTKKTTSSSKWIDCGSVVAVFWVNKTGQHWGMLASRIDPPQKLWLSKDTLIGFNQETSDESYLYDDGSIYELWYREKGKKRISVHKFDEKENVFSVEKNLPGFVQNWQAKFASPLKYTERGFK